MAQQITLNVENVGILSSLRKVLSLIEGVTIVDADSRPRTKKSARKLSSYEQAMDDLKNNRVSVYENAEEFYKEMGI